MALPCSDRTSVGVSDKDGVERRPGVADRNISLVTHSRDDKVTATRYTQGSCRRMKKGRAWFAGGVERRGLDP